MIDLKVFQDERREIVEVMDIGMAAPCGRTTLQHLPINRAEADRQGHTTAASGQRLTVSAKYGYNAHVRDARAIGYDHVWAGSTKRRQHPAAYEDHSALVRSATYTIFDYSIAKTKKRRDRRMITTTRGSSGSCSD